MDKGRAALGIERRWRDYCQVVEGTPGVLGTVEPRPPDLREAAIAAFNGTQTGKWEAVEAVLNTVWVIDAPSWPRRLSLFLNGLPAPAINAFAGLVRAGCQPDMLAFQFHEAVQAEEYSKDHDRIWADLNDLDRLATRAAEALEMFANRRRQFDEYLETRRLRVIEGEPGDAQLKVLLWDFEDLVDRHKADNERLRRQTDGRRQTLLGHAEVRLSRHVYEITGAYHDRSVECVLEELRVRSGQLCRAPGALSKRRRRRSKRLFTRVIRRNVMRDETRD